MTKHPYPDACGHILFQEQARRASNSTALISEDENYTYGQLDEMSGIVADEVSISSVGSEFPVGLCMGSSPQAIAAVLGILKAGGVVVPLDPGYPRERLHRMIVDAKLGLVLADSSADQLPCIATKTVLLDRTFWYRRRIGAKSNDALTLDNASFVLYTSGSTGAPKGVVRVHRAIASRLAWASFYPDDVFCHNMPLSFGFSQERLFLPLMRGLPLAVVPEMKCRDPLHLVTFLERYAVTKITVVPDMLRQMMDVPYVGQRLTRLREVAVGGAQFPVEVVERFRRELPKTNLINAYGSTESGSAIRGRIELPQDSAHIGTPVHNVTVHIMDSHMEPVTRGANGEIFIEGPCIAKGYLNQPELTESRFPWNPLRDGERFCRTGDYGRYLPTGEIQLIGRMDRQVKVRGFRIELDDVEAALLSFKHVRDVHVCTSGNAVNPRLLAYIAEGPETSSISELRKHLAERLPSHMIPASFIFLTEIPKGFNGKVNTSALPTDSRSRPNLDVAYKSCNTAEEIKLAHIWEDVLNKDQLGADDGFWELGGDSLLLTQLLHLVEEHFSVTMSPQQFSDTPTIKTLAARIIRLRSVQNLDSIVSIPEVARSGVLFPSISQEALLLAQLRNEIRRSPTIVGATGFGLSLQGPLDIEGLSHAINQILSRHEVFRTAFVPVGLIGQMRIEGLERIRHLYERPVLQTTFRFEARVKSGATVVPAIDEDFIK